LPAPMTEASRPGTSPPSTCRRCADMPPTSTPQSSRRAGR
jgi:hypothetical protein